MAVPELVADIAFYTERVIDKEEKLLNILKHIIIFDCCEKDERKICKLVQFYLNLNLYN